MTATGEDAGGVLRFELSAIAVGHAYPPAEVSAEIGRVVIAAARVDRELALNLVATRYPEPLEELLRWTTGHLVKHLRLHLGKHFEGALLSSSLQRITTAAAAVDDRHQIVHTIWNLGSVDALISVADLASADTPEALDRLLRLDVTSPDWEPHQPRTQQNAPGSVDELTPIRERLERAQDDLQALRMTLASALFAGVPAGARQVLPI